MRRFNAVLSAAILVLFLIHGVLGAFNLMGIGQVTTKVLAWTMVFLIAVHAVIGIVLTAGTIRAGKLAGATYPGANRLFWARRISGFIIMVLIFFHISAFSGVSAEHYRLPEFTLFKLVLQILLVLSIVFHVVTNAKPMLLSFGSNRLKERTGDVAFWMMILLILMTAGMILYYIRWMAI